MLQKLFSNHIFLLLSLGLAACTGGTPTPAPTPVPLSLDNFRADNINSPTCQPFGTEHTLQTLDYCIYYVNAVPGLSYIASDGGQQALKIEYALEPNPTPGWENWFSVRFEFPSAIDLSHYTGLAINLSVGKSAVNTQIRFALADIETGKNGSDELWWCTRGDILERPDKDWQKVECSFDDFVWGDVGRSNDRVFNLQQIVAYEITVLSDPGTSPSGVFFINSVEAR